MEEAKGVAKLIILAQFKDEVSPAEFEDFIKEYANLVKLIPPLKDFTWGLNTTIGNGMNQEYTHVFELIFKDVEGVKEYMAHPEHVKFVDVFNSKVKQFIAIDYVPISALL